MRKNKTNKRKSTTKKKPAKKDTKDLVKKECTDEEKARIAKYKERNERRPVKVKAVENDSGETMIELQDADDPLTYVKMSEAFGTADADLRAHLLVQVVNTFKEVSEDGTGTEVQATVANKVIPMLSGIQPQDEIEAMLAVQMIGVHNMAMDCIGKATRTDRVDFMSTYMNGATKSLRTFAAQMEALKKYRTGGQQKMIVEHVHVNEGGQAIVGTVNQGGSMRDNDKK